MDRMERKTLSVIVPCHNYAAFLPACLQSILGQTLTPDEVIVVDDASDDNPQEVVAKFADRGVRCIRVDNHDPLRTRRAGIEESFGDIICCVDPDDCLDPFYFETGMKYFADYRIAIVYSDVVYSGDKEGRSDYPRSTQIADLSSENYIHSGALVRREAITVSDAFHHGGPANRHEDWSTWRRIVECGFEGVKQESFYHYNKHRGSLSENRHYEQNGYSYFTGAALSEEPITILSLLGGNISHWDEFERFLVDQTWDHKKCRLIVADYSEAPALSRAVRSSLAESDYRDMHYCRISRMRVRAERTAQVCVRLRRVVSTNYVLIVEDGIIPPVDVCEKLMACMCQHTVSVSAACPHSSGEGFFAWSEDGKLLREGVGVQAIGGNGFGCVLLRTRALQSAAICRSAEGLDFPQAFYRQFTEPKLVKINWAVRCRPAVPRFGVKGRVCPLKPLAPQDFDEEYYLASNLDVRVAVSMGRHKSGSEHYVMYGLREGRSFRPRLPV